MRTISIKLANPWKIRNTRHWKGKTFVFYKHKRMPMLKPLKANYTLEMTHEA